jgi:hypothetical protein
MVVLTLIGGVACGLTADDGDGEPAPNSDSRETAAPGSGQPNTGSGDSEYEAAEICSTVVPFGGFYPQGCSPGAPSAGSACDVEGALCRKELVNAGQHIRQRVAKCKDGSWQYESVPCSNECTAPGPNPVEVPDECGPRSVVSCDGGTLRDAVYGALIQNCSDDMYENDIQVELDQGCATHFSSNRGTSACVLELLRSQRWSCDDVDTCVTVGTHAL